MYNCLNFLVSAGQPFVSAASKHETASAPVSQVTERLGVTPLPLMSLPRGVRYLATVSTTAEPSVSFWMDCTSPLPAGRGEGRAQRRERVHAQRRRRGEHVACKRPGGSP